MANGVKLSRTIRAAMGISLLAAGWMILATGYADPAAAAPTKQPAKSDTRPKVASPAPTPTPTEEKVLPTADDAKTLESFQALLKQVDKPDSPGRELANNTRIGWVTVLPKVLASKVPVRKSELNGARGYFSWMMPQLEAATTMTTPEALTVDYTTSAINIDGKLDDAAWAKAKPIAIAFEGAKANPAAAATARVLWDQRYLYIGFSVPDNNIIAPDLPRDGPVYMYDCVEVFLCPDTRFRTYWELNVSPTSGLFDNLMYKYPDRWGDDAHPDETMEGLQIGHVFDGTPNNENDRDNGYSIELAIPFNQLPGFARGGRAGDHLNLMLARVEKPSKDGQCTYLGHTPFVAWFHNIWAYQPVVLRDAP